MSDRRWAVAALLLAPLPLVRTAGLAMWVACAGWLMLDRQRHRTLRFTLLLGAFIPYGLWMLRNAQSGQESYLGYLWHQLTESNVGESLHQVVWSTILNYHILVGLWVPGGAPGSPVYGIVTSYPALLPIAAWPFTALVASAMLAMCALGIWARRHEGGTLNERHAVNPAR